MRATMNPAPFLTCLMAVCLIGVATTAQAEDEPPSHCLAIASKLPNVVYAAYEGTPQTISDAAPALTPHQVRITFKTHSTYVIETSSGVTIATDYAGFAGGVIPRVATMNRAHETHYTNYPDPKIEFVLRGWGLDEDSKAKHRIMVEDVLIRNVTTDIVYGNFRQIDQNSIFIFEVAGLCIGHLGHLHHALTDTHFAEIGRLDIVMVPIDGGLTLSLGPMTEIVERLRSSIILPMHARGWVTPADFIAMLGDGYDHIYLDGSSITVSLNDLPSRPTVMVPRGL